MSSWNLALVGHELRMDLTQELAMCIGAFRVTSKTSSHRMQPSSIPSFANAPTILLRMVARGSLGMMASSMHAYIVFCLTLSSAGNVAIA